MKEIKEAMDTLEILADAPHMNELHRQILKEIAANVRRSASGYGSEPRPIPNIDLKTYDTVFINNLSINLRRFLTEPGVLSATVGELISALGHHDKRPAQPDEYQNNVKAALRWLGRIDFAKVRGLPHKQCIVNAKNALQHIIDNEEPNE